LSHKSDGNVLSTKSQRQQHLISKAKKIGLRNKNITTINALSRKQIDDLLALAALLEPFRDSAINLLPTKLMATLFFEPSTRTRLSFETAMNRLGGRVISEATALISSSAAKEESLEDSIRVISEYANVIVLRHHDAETAERATQRSTVPVISGGFGDKEHPTQALLDLYTIYRTLKRIDGSRVTIACPDLTKARTGHSLALALARYKSEITLVSPSLARTPDYVIKSLAGASFKEVTDPSREEYASLVQSSDIVYLPGCRVPKGDESREAFRKLSEQYLVSLEMLEKAKEDGKMVYLMHCLPRFPGEMDLRVDDTSHAIYFKQAGYGVPLRMALLLSLLC
jgi:aspartate carbamoyltransferase catalytic subunit